MHANWSKVTLFKIRMNIHEVAEILEEEIGVDTVQKNWTYSHLVQTVEAKRKPEDLSQ